MVATSISLGCETDTAASTIDYEIKADRQVPFKYRLNLNIEEIEKLSDEKLDQIEKLNDAFELSGRTSKRILNIDRLIRINTYHANDTPGPMAII